MTVYDCFIIGNELDMLEVRLNTLNNLVDKFVIVEATKTFSFEDKPLHFKENKKRFKPFAKKIIHIVVDDLPEDATPMGREHSQRDAIIHGLKHADPSDFIMLSDVDEIPMPHIIEPLIKEGLPFSLGMMTYYYGLNRRSVQDLKGTTGLLFADFQGGQWMRDQRNILPYYPDAVWHFSCFGGAAAVAHKLRTFSHSDEYGQGKYVDVERLQYCIDNKIDLLERPEFPVVEVPLVNLPPYIMDNFKRFKHWVVDSGERAVAAVLNYNRPDLVEVMFDQLGEEMILVENGSSKPVSILCPVIISPANLLFSGGWNYAMKNIDAEWVWMLNSDLLNVSDGMLQGLLSCALLTQKHSPKVAVISPAFNSPHGHHWRQADNPNLVRRVPWIDWCCPLVNMKAWKEVGEFDEAFKGYGADLDWCKRAERMGWQFFISDLFEVHHLSGQTTITEGGNGINDPVEMDRLLAEKYGVSSWMQLF